MSRIGLVLVAFGATLALLGARALAQTALTPGPTKELLSRTCTACHELTMLTDTGGMSREDWEGTLNDMQGYGAQLTAEERGQMLEYLVANLPPKKK